jgi:predicted lipoprotein with Yx(FWY)xxD motif
MDQTMQVRTTTRRATIGRMAVAAVAVGGLSATAFATSAGAATKVVVSTTKNAQFGKILVSGKTLYTLKPSKTACNATCLKVWPALVLPKGVKKATAGSGVSASKLGTTTRAGGVRQVTYRGKPLYWFSGDTGSGQVNGNVTDEWGKWTAVVTAKSGSGSTATATTAGSGGTAF